MFKVLFEFYNPNLLTYSRITLFMTVLYICYSLEYICLCNKLCFGFLYEQGRDGLGSVYVSTTGNSGGEETDVFRDSCSYDRLVANRYVISVAGTQLMISTRIFKPNVNLLKT